MLYTLDSYEMFDSKLYTKVYCRLSPPVTGTVRITTTDVRLSGHAVPKGVSVLTLCRPPSLVLSSVLECSIFPAEGLN